MKKILVGYLDDLVNSGIDKYLLTFLNNIDIDNYEIDFITKNNNLKFDYKNCSLKYVSQNRQPIKQMREMKKMITENKYDVAYFNISECYNFIGVLQAKRYKIKKIVVHSHSSGSDSNNKIKRIIASILNTLCKPIINKCSTDKLSCSKLAAKWLYNKKIVRNNCYTMIYNAVDKEKFKYNPEIRNKIRNEYLLEDKIVLGHVGRFCYQKNHEFLIQILNELLKENDNYRLICIGDGESFNSINELSEKLNIKDKIIFTKTINNVNEYMNAFDIFLLPSRFEGLPIVGVEAQTNLLPCILSDKITDEAKISSECYFENINNVNSWINRIKSINKRENTLNENAILFDMEYQKNQFENILR